MHPQYGHSPPTSSRSTTARVSPLPCSPPAIASPATPAPRDTTSNSCGSLITSHRGRAAQRFQQRCGRKCADVPVAFEDGGAFGGARDRGRERLGEAAAQRDPRLVRPRPARRMFQGQRVDIDDRHTAYQPLASKELGDIRARGPREDDVRSVVLRDLRLHLEQADAVSDQDRLIDIVRYEDDCLAPRALDVDELVLKALPRDAIHRPERLVPKEDRRNGAQRARGTHPRATAPPQL